MLYANRFNKLVCDVINAVHSLQLRDEEIRCFFTNARGLLRMRKCCGVVYPLNSTNLISTQGRIKYSVQMFKFSGPKVHELSVS